jgi:hypothetical protein
MRTRSDCFFCLAPLPNKAHSLQCTARGRPERTAQATPSLSLLNTRTTSYERMIATSRARLMLSRDRTCRTALAAAERLVRLTPQGNPIVSCPCSGSACCGAPHVHPVTSPVPDCQTHAQNNPSDLVPHTSLLVPHTKTPSEIITASTPDDSGAYTSILQTKCMTASLGPGTHEVGRADGLSEARAHGDAAIAHVMPALKRYRLLPVSTRRHYHACGIGVRSEVMPGRSPDRLPHQKKRCQGRSTGLAGCEGIILMVCLFPH